jgi:hypothetical protein
VLALQFRLTLCGGAAVPLPVRDSTTVGFEALLANVSVAAVAPLLWGVKATVKGTLCPSETVRGNESPLNTNSELVLVPDDTTTFPPVAVSVPGRLLLVPTVTFPNARVNGETAREPAAVPFPDSGILRVEGFALETTETLPLALPVVVGVKISLKVTLWPAVRVKGTVRPCWRKPVPLVVA